MDEQLIEPLCLFLRCLRIVYYMDYQKGRQLQISALLTNNDKSLYIASGQVDSLA